MLLQEGEEMRLVRMISGISILTASAWIGPAVAQWLGYSEVFGFISISSIIAFFGGMLFYSGLPVVGLSSFKFKGA